jgi:hypothetical protein
VVFCAPPELQLAPGTKALAYHHSADPHFLHLTTGDGRILGTWSQRGRTAFLDSQALAEAMRYTHAARAAAMATASELAAPERAALDAMRQHNAGLEQFIVTTDVPNATATLNATGIANGFEAVKAASAEAKAKQRAADQFVKREGAAAAEDILSADPAADGVRAPELSTAGDDLLGAL